VLRFNADTRQSVALCALPPAGSSAANPPATAQPEVLAMEYLKVLAAQALGLWRLLRADDADAAPPPRVLCLGGGGCSLPLFLARFLPPGAVVDVAEIDPAVVEAAHGHMGVAAAAAALSGRATLRVHARSAQDFLSARGEDATSALVPYDLVVLDAFDGEDNVPPELLSPPFLRALRAVMRPRAAALLLNAHGGQLPPLRVDEALAAAARALRRQPPDARCRRYAGYDAAAPDGARVVAAAVALAAALGGTARAARVEEQGNVIISVLLGDGDDGDATSASTSSTPARNAAPRLDVAFSEALRAAADAAAAEAGVPFECGERSVRGLHVVADAPDA
jgi:hypothetical protein